MNEITSIVNLDLDNLADSFRDSMSKKQIINWILDNLMDKMDDPHEFVKLLDSKLKPYHNK